MLGTSLVCMDTPMEIILKGQMRQNKGLPFFFNPAGRCPPRTPLNICVTL